MTKMISTNDGKTNVEDNNFNSDRAHPDSRNTNDPSAPLERLPANPARVERHVSIDSGVEVDLDVSHDNGNDGEAETETGKLQDEGLLLPKYTCGVYDDLLVLKINVKNVEQNKVKRDAMISRDGTGFSLRFSTLASDGVSKRFGFDLVFIFDTNQIFSFSLDDLDVDIWDNGIIAKATLPAVACSYYKIGNGSGTVRDHYLPQLKAFKQKTKGKVEKSSGTSKMSDLEDRPIRELSEARAASAPTLTCGILKTYSPRQTGNSQIIGENCSGPSSSIKKSVRFNEVVKRQIFRTNSSILGRRIKNLKKSEQKKRRTFDRRASEADVQSIGGTSPESSRQGSVESPTSRNAQYLSFNDNPDEAGSTAKSTVKLDSKGTSEPDHNGIAPSESVDNVSTNVDFIFELDV